MNSECMQRYFYIKPKEKPRVKAYFESSEIV